MVRDYVRKRRSRLEIKMEILRSCLTPNVPTRMMYATNVAWWPFRDIIEELQEKGLVKFQKRKTRPHGGRDRRILGLYEITEKGRSALETYQVLEDDLVG